MPTSFLVEECQEHVKASLCNVVSGWRRRRTCESIARLKNEHNQRTKCCNLQLKYHSFSPQKWFRSRHDLRFFEKRVNTSVFCVHQGKKRFKKGRKCCNLQGFGALTGKKLRKYQRFSVQKWLIHRYLQCFVLSTFSWNCKNRVNINIFCDQPAKNAVIYNVVFALLSKTLVFAVFCASLVENVLVFTAFYAFLYGSRKRRQNAKML